MHDGDNIFLVGPMGVGKSSVGRRLASRLGRNFIDCDEELMRRTGVEIGVIFDIEGEDGFRARESKLLLELVKMRGIVLATGGGAVLLPENRAALKHSGTVVYLRAAPELLGRRTARDKKRPLLQDGDRMLRIRELAAQRESLYQEVADCIVDTGEGSVSHSVNLICRALQLPCAK
ncbi:MAG: shikimate kinase [Gammaproteobacteria bacterium]|nr:shikimate kinase [Gammaproteobacteria bacterium]